jgi:hypothetical protein
MAESFKSILRFLAAFTTSVLAKMSGAISALALIVGFFLSGFVQISFYVVSAVSFVVASYAIWKSQDDVIAKLRKRPYDDAVEGFVTTQLATLGADHRDLLRYFATSGEVWIDDLQADCGVAVGVLNPVLTATAQTRLLAREERPISGRSGTHMFWWIASQYLPVVKDTLFPRKEATPQQWFQGRMIFPTEVSHAPIVSNWKGALLLLGIVATGIAAVMVFRSVQRNRDLAETLLWMDQTYNPHEGGDNLGQGHGWETHYLQKGQVEEVTENFKMTFVRLGGCNIVINSETLPRGIFSDTPSTSKYTINLCDIDPGSIKIKTYDLHSKDVFDCSDPEQVKSYELNCNNAEIEFLTRNGATAIGEERVETFTKLTGNSHEFRTASKTNKCWLIVDDVNYAQRLAKALKHAVELCGGKTSKF